MKQQIWINEFNSLKIGTFVGRYFLPDDVLRHIKKRRAWTLEKTEDILQQINSSENFITFKSGDIYASFVRCNEETFGFIYFEEESVRIIKTIYGKKDDEKNGFRFVSTFEITEVSGEVPDTKDFFREEHHTYLEEKIGGAIMKESEILQIFSDKNRRIPDGKIVVKQEGKNTLQHIRKYLKEKYNIESTLEEYLGAPQLKILDEYSFVDPKFGRLNQRLKEHGLRSVKAWNCDCTDIVFHKNTVYVKNFAGDQEFTVDKIFKIQVDYEKNTVNTFATEEAKCFVLKFLNDEELNEFLEEAREHVPRYREHLKPKKIYRGTKTAAPTTIKEVTPPNYYILKIDGELKLLSSELDIEEVKAKINIALDKAEVLAVENLSLEQIKDDHNKKLEEKIRALMGMKI